MSKKKQSAKKSKKQPTTPTTPQTETQREPDFELVGNLAKDALNPKSGVAREDIEQQVGKLSADEAAVFLRILEVTLKRRRIQLLGYLCALFAVVFGMIFALYMWSKREPGTFIGWVFILPPATGALAIWLFGKWSNSVR